MTNDKIIKWLLDGDVSVQYQVYRDLLQEDRSDLKERISLEGWGARLLSCRKNTGHWGLGFYQPKCTSSHYTILELKHLSISNKNKEIRDTINKIVLEGKGFDGGVNPAAGVSKSDVCINGMFLNYASYFGEEEQELKSIIDFIISQQLPDGGFNCQFNRKGARHSSLHSTISVLEGISEYSKNGYSYKLDELKEIETQTREFILEHKLYKSDKTGEVIDKRMTMLSYPSGWRYDILRALEYFYFARVSFDSRMNDAIELLLSKQRKDKTWPLQQRYSGETHFDMEKTGTSSRWNTLRALRVLNYFGFVK